MASKVSTTTRPKLLVWKDALPWQRDNEFVLTGYRRASFSYTRSIRSIFALHNETANIWSQLLGDAYFATVLYQHCKLTAEPNGVRTADVAALSIYNLSVTVCFVLSTVFHTFSDHNQEMHKRGNELDHLGIVLVMWGTGVSGTHFAFYCDAAPRNAHLAVLSATALGCGVLTLRPACRTARFLVYCFLGASLFAPVVHGLWRLGREGLEGAMGLASFLGLALVNFSGAAVYAIRVPERWFPGRFDLLGQSHNWMHVLVLAGALVRLRGLLQVAARWQVDNEQYGVCSSLR